MCRHCAAERNQVAAGERGDKYTGTRDGGLANMSPVGPQDSGPGDRSEAGKARNLVEQVGKESCFVVECRPRSIYHPLASRAEWVDLMEM
jgi:hypothetical protein